MNCLRRVVALVCLLTTICGSVGVAQGVGDLADYNEAHSRLSGAIERYQRDLGSISRFYSASTSPRRQARLRQFYNEWLGFLQRQDFNSLTKDEQIDYQLFGNYLRHELGELERRGKQLEEMSALIPFASTISSLEDGRRKLEPIDVAKTAALLNELNKQIIATQKSIEAGRIAKPKKTVANRAARTVADLRETLSRWNRYYNGYDPAFSWWNAAPYNSVDASLQSYQAFLLDKLVGIKPDDKTTIIGDPIGREALLQELEYEMIPYTPEELLQIANKEFAWCEVEMKKASREMGFGDDWKKALEAVKQHYVEPGKQPALIRELALEATRFVQQNKLVTVPPLAVETWRMEMMSPEQQLVAPFFLGGEAIQVSYPTSGMSHEQKMMSMRGNNKHFARATVHHELIPGHRLQDFMMDRYRAYRQMFYTPFWMEGWALYWEMRFWDMKYAKTPEDRVGVLFWRMHRCARIIFSLNFHLEKMSPQEAVDFLVDRVGHERDNASGEVRRSFSGDYGPLYQVAYMIGGLQFYQLHKEVVDSKTMNEREFHDAILKEGPIPVEMVRKILSKRTPGREEKAEWRFYSGLGK
jgi:uncharacterized protein (DUF885 family)